MNGSLLLSILSALLPLTGAVPNHGHTHAHIHRDFHDNTQRDHGHTHGHAHRDVLDVLDVQPAVKPRATPKSGCGRRPKAKGTGKGKSVPPSPLSSAGLPSNLGGVFVTSSANSTNAVVATSASSTSDTSSPTIVVPSSLSSTTTSSTSSSEAVEANTNVAHAVVAPSSSSLLEAFQSSYTLATRTTSPTPVTTSTSAAATITAASGSGGGSGSGGSSSGDADNLTVVVRNMMSDALTTSHAMNADLPARVQAITATLTDGTMSPGATASMVYPSGWAGNMFAAKVGSSEDVVVDLADGSLIEGSFNIQLGDTPVNDMDVSYVSGFSVPITCTCEDDTITFGCSIDLFAEGECPDTCDDGPCLQGATCRNPLRYLDEDGLTAAPFFMPCQGKAFTWARDDANSQNSRCTSNYISCCIGTEADGCPSTT